MLGTNYYLTKIIEAFIIGFGVAYLFGPISIKLAHKLGVIDTPRDARRVHKKPIPRFGGMSIFMGSMAAMLIPAGMNANIKVAMIGGALMYLLGIWDDIKDIKPIVKFGGQVLIASLVYFLGIRITFIGSYLVAFEGTQAHLIQIGRAHV